MAEMMACWLGAVGEAGAHRIDLAGLKQRRRLRIERQAHRTDQRSLRHRMMAIGRPDGDDLGEVCDGQSRADRGQRVVHEQRCQRERRVRLPEEACKAFRPIVEPAHRDVDLERIGMAVVEPLERPQRAPAVEAEQRADVLRAGIDGGAFAGKYCRCCAIAGSRRVADRGHGFVQAIAGVANGGQLAWRLVPHHALNMRRHVLRRAVGGVVDRLPECARHATAANEQAVPSIRR